MIKTILFIVPNHSLGHAVESLSLALELQSSYHVLFIAEQKTDILLRQYNFQVIALPARDAFFPNQTFYFDAYLDDCVESLIATIRPQIVISNFPSFMSSAYQTCRELHIPHISIYSQFSVKNVEHILLYSNLLISGIPPSLAYCHPDVHFVGPLSFEKPLKYEEMSELDQKLRRPFVLINMGGGFRRGETCTILQTIGTVAERRTDINFVCICELALLNMPMPENVYMLGPVSPDVMSFLQEQCQVGVFRAGYSLMEMAARHKPFIAIALPRAHEQVQRSTLLANAGACEYIYAEDLTTELLLSELDQILTNPEPYVQAQCQLKIEFGAKRASRLIENILASKNTATECSVRIGTVYYPFGNGLIQVTQRPDIIVIEGYHQKNTNLRPSRIFAIEIDFDRLSFRQFFPDWLISHSPYFVRKLLGARPHELQAFPSCVRIADTENFGCTTRCEGEINGRHFKAQCMHLGETEKVRIEVQVPQGSV